MKGLFTGLLLTPVLLSGYGIFPAVPQFPDKPDSRVLPNFEQAPNHAPRVEIRQPVKGDRFSWNSQVPYQIEISDAEDGESKYQEIQPLEVVVKLKYVESMAKARAYLKQRKFSDTAGMMRMLASNCFNCHAVKSRLAGPSFQEISLRYRQAPDKWVLLINHIQQGSSGIWGKEVMPTHPELKDTAATQMVNWIMSYANDPGLNFFVGLQGVLPLNKPGIYAGQGLFIVTAYYTDHGSADFPNKRITGSDLVIINMKSRVK